MNNNFIAVTIGDINGIGIELLIRAWKLKKIKKFILFTNQNFFDNYLKNNKKKVKYKIINNFSYNDFKNYDSNFLIYTFKSKNIYDNTYQSLKQAYNYTKNKNLIGIVTLPLNKHLIIKNIDKSFIGQTEYFQKIDKKKHSNMIFIHDKIIVATLTNHIKLNEVIKNIKKTEKIFNKIKILNNTLIKKFNIKNPKFLISGINPHSGEMGVFGDEEIKFQKPLIEKLIKNNINITGPISGDSMVTKLNIKKYDCLIFNYHDQALIPFKIISNYSGINFTDGLSILRVSPDHGTAYDIVGKKIANSLSLINCFKILKKIYNHNKP
tara:strand:- start:941 stop:1909 length:969 start_codon:yes stop_codon:yes gene_type:complete